MVTVNAFLQRVFLLMMGGLVSTGLTSYYFAQYLMSDKEAMNTVFGSPLRWLVILAPLIIFLVTDYIKDRISASTVALMFGAMSVTMGLSLSLVFFIYTTGSIAATFFIAAGMFAAMAAFGWTTKKDLTEMGTYLYMALFGLIIASVLNYFMRSEAIYWVTSFAGVLIFTGLTAYDVQKIVRESASQDTEEQESQKLAIYGALSLYLDFINLFINLLRFFGNRK